MYCPLHKAQSLFSGFIFPGIIIREFFIFLCFVIKQTIIIMQIYGTNLILKPLSFLLTEGFVNTPMIEPTLHFAISTAHSMMFTQ